MPGQPEQDPRTEWLNAEAEDQDGTHIVYWMQHAQRIRHNPALLAADRRASERGLPLVILFIVTPSFPHANRRHLTFMMEGLDECAAEAESLGIPLIVELGNPPDVLAEYASRAKPRLIIADTNPLGFARGWRHTAADSLSIPMAAVDADVVVPSQLFPKEEYSAYTLRRKLHEYLPAFLQPTARFPQASYRQRLPESLKSRHCAQPSSMLRHLRIDESVGPVTGAEGGFAAGEARIQRFLQDRLPTYDTQRNHPEKRGTTELSPYLHFGQISVTDLACRIRDAEAPENSRQALLEQLIVRRELAVNYALRNPDYGTLAGCPEWARKTLKAHESDPREYVYTRDELEAATTHDPLWNAAQRQMLQEGWMHGYMRMYWAKKILEWSPSPAEAFEHAIYLNDRFLLDGRDPNGYTGIAWALGGRHDRAWGPERPIFGTVRFMSLASTGRKFDSRAYIDQYST